VWNCRGESGLLDDIQKLLDFVKLIVKNKGYVKIFSSGLLFLGFLVDFHGLFQIFWHRIIEESRGFRMIYKTSCNS
jgi:hypothetical protein